MKLRLSSFILLLSSFGCRVGRRLRRSRLFVPLCVFCGYSISIAAGMSSVHSLESGNTAITNTQKHSSWVPVALLFKFDAPASGTITIERLVPCDSDLGTPGSTAFLLTSCAVSNNLSAVWIPESAFPFNLNDVLSVTSTITNATVEIIRKADQ